MYPSNTELVIHYIAKPFNIMPNGQWPVLDIQGKHYLDNEQCIELSLVHSLVSDDV